MKKIFLLLVSAAVLVSCNLPFVNNPTPEPTLAPATETVALPTLLPTESQPTAAASETSGAATEVEMEDIRMEIPACLPVTASVQIAAAQLPDPNGGPMSVWPEHRLITFSGYPLNGKFLEPMVRVFPLEEYTPIWEFAASQLTRMQNLLSTLPADTADPIPFLPNLGAAEVFHLNRQFLAFQNGNGVRYLTEYAQYYAPFNNHDLFYSYQGITSDGKYWISAIFPINHPILPPSYDSTEVPPGGLPIPQMSSSTYEADMQAYMASMKLLLENSPHNTFTPDIDCLDLYFASLRIHD